MKEISKYGVELFLRTIGIDVNTCTKALENDLLDFIDRSINDIGCCMLWHSALNNSNTELSKILQKHNVQPNHHFFNIIINDQCVLFSDDVNSSPKVRKIL